MQIISGTAPGALRLADLGRELSPNARRRLKWMDYYESHGENARLACRHFDISPQTFYRWRRRYNPRRLASLEDRSRCPHQVRQPTWTPELVEAVQQLREHYPRWGKDKLTPLLRAAGWSVSTSMVGRILGHLKKRGILVEPPPLRLPVRRPRPPRPYAVRKPKEYQARRPGDIVQVDSLDLRPLPGVVFKHFTARDVVSRWDILEVHSRATATTAATFLDAIQTRAPFPIRAIQVDGGSEFQAAFESECQRRQIRLFVLPPRSPKLNGHVERAQRTHTEEFYEVWDLTWTVADLNRELLAWEQIYNTVRPHQALAYRTPQKFLQEFAHAGMG
ncbi:MAG: helix-turn-helix domain-containing protein [Anaerolineae bacterium]